MIRQPGEGDMTGADIMTDADIVRDGDLWTEFAREVDVEPLSETIAKFLAYKDLDSLLYSNAGHFPRFMDRLSETLRRAFEENCHRSLFQVHKALYYLYEDNIRKPQPGAGLNQYHPFVIRLRNEIEKAWEAFELQRIDLTLEEIPSDEDAFIRFLKTRCFSHRMATHPLFAFLEKDATYDEIVSFFMHEGVLVLRFCDLIVLSMLGVDEEVRGEVVENFWDEVGAGNYRDRHTEMFKRLLRHAGVELRDANLLSQDFIDNLDWQGLAGYNLYLYLSLHRRNYFKSVGCMGVAEMMDPSQYEKIVRGCRRVGLKDEDALAYYVDHVEMDTAHGEAWLMNIMVPLIRQYPETRYDMLVGALMRLNTAGEYYDFLHAKLAGEGSELSAFRGGKLS